MKIINDFFGNRSLRLMLLLCGLGAFMSAQAQYMDAAAFELKGKVNSCVVKDETGKVLNSYTFAEDGECQIINGELFSTKYSEVKRDENKRLISVTENKNSDTLLGMMFRQILPSTSMVEWDYDENGYLIKERFILDGDMRSASRYDDFNYEGFPTKGTKGSFVVEDVIRIISYSGYVSDLQGNWIKRDVYDAESKKKERTETREITYYSSNSNSQPVKTGPSAVFKGTRTLYLDGAEVAIQANVVVNGAKGKNVQFTAFFDGENQGIPLKDKNNNYCNIEGNVCTWTELTATYDSSHWEMLVLRIPFFELHLPNGWSTINMRIFAFVDGKQIGHSDFQTIKIYANGVSASNFIVVGGEATPGFFE